MSQVDWLEFTISDSQRVPFMEWAYRFGFVELDHGFLGYDCAAAFASTGRVLWSSDPARAAVVGVHVSLPSSCLAALAIADYNLARVFSCMVLWGCKVTRIDVAFDDRDGLLDFDHLVDLTRDKLYVSRLRSVDFREQICRSADLPLGRTLYYGAPSSRTRIRVYDKAAEQNLKDVHWIRVEIQLRDDRARALFDASVESVTHTMNYNFGDVLLGLLDFKVQVQDTNMSRWPTCSWWLEFTDASGKLHLSVEKVSVESIEAMRKWIDRQVSPTLAALMMVSRGDIGWLTNSMREGRDRLSPMKRALVSFVNGEKVNLSAVSNRVRSRLAALADLEFDSE